MTAFLGTVKLWRTTRLIKLILSGHDGSNIPYALFYMHKWLSKILHLLSVFMFQRWISKSPFSVLVLCPQKQIKILDVIYQKNPSRWSVRDCRSWTFVVLYDSDFIQSSIKKFLTCICPKNASEQWGLSVQYFFKLPT